MASQAYNNATMIDSSDILAPSELENSDLLKPTDDGDFAFDLASKSLLFMTANNTPHHETNNANQINSNNELNLFKSNSSSSYNSSNSNNNNTTTTDYHFKLGLNLTGNLIEIVVLFS